MPTPTYIPIASYSLSSPASSVTFSAIDQSYRDLVIVASTTFPEVYAVFNSDTGSNYSVQWILGYSGTAYAGVTTLGKAAFSRSAWNGTLVASIMDYTATDKYKTWHSQAQGTGNSVESFSGTWRTSAASPITSIRLEGLGGGNYPAGSTFALFGIHG